MTHSEIAIQAHIAHVIAIRDGSAFSNVSGWAELPRFIFVTGKNPQRKPSAWAVHINREECRGYFEHDAEGEGGGLWFERKPDGSLSLTDYDGVGELPNAVEQTLRNHFDCSYLD